MPGFGPGFHDDPLAKNARDGIPLAFALALIKSRRRSAERTCCASTPFPKPRPCRCMPASPRASSRGAASRSTLHLTENSQEPARRARRRQVRHRAFRGRQRARHDRGRQAGRGDRHRRRQRHERILRPARDQVVRRSARTHAGGRRARHRLCAAGEEDPARGTASRKAPTTPSSRSAPASTGFKAMLESKDNAAAHPQPAVHRAGRGGRPEEPRAHHRPARPLSGAGRLRDARLGARATARCSSATSPPMSRRCAGCAIPQTAQSSVALLVEKLKISPKEAERTYDLLLDPGFGFTPDAPFDPEGFRNMLALRAEIAARPGARPTGALHRSRLLRAGDEARCRSG